MSLVDTYLAGLHRRLPEKDREALAMTHGASQEDLRRLCSQYPHCPTSLLELLRTIDGTHFRKYPGCKVCVLVLGSDVFEYPYYLSSAEQILEEARKPGKSIRATYGDWIERDPALLGAGIDPDVPMGLRLCFSNCMNNGGTSRLFVDFDPAPGGQSGQIVRFLHDPDGWVVIAGSFDEYLRRLIDEDYAFVLDDE